MTENRARIEGQIEADWLAGHFVAAHDCICAGFLPILCASLHGKGVQYHDAEEIVSDALYGFTRKINKDGPASVDSPCRYLWTAVNHAWRDQHRRRSKTPISEGSLHLEPRGNAPHSFLERQGNRKIYEVQSSPRRNRAIFAVQALSEIDDISESDATRLVKAILARMSPKHRTMMKNVLRYGGGEASAEAAARLGLRGGNYRTLKHRAYRAFRDLAVPVAGRLGITWRGITDDEPPFILEDATEDQNGGGND
jgi:DNA-directed RNA polymerase specialized sigma24 family protein